MGGAVLKTYDKYTVYQILIKERSLFRGPSLTDKKEALQWLKEHAELDDLIYVYPILFKNNLELGLLAAEIVTNVMEKFTQKQWNTVYDSLKYLKIDKDTLSVLLKYPEQLSIHLIGVATLNSNGYVREKALRILSGAMKPAVIPYVLLRLSDWVEPIRGIAYHVLRNTLTIHNIDAFIVNFYLIEKLKHICRVDLNKIREEIIYFLKDEAVVERIKQYLKHSNVKVRLFCYSILSDQLVNDKAIIQLAQRDRSFEVRLWLIEVLDKLSYKEQLEVIKILRHDKSARVKVALLRKAEEIIITEHNEFILEMACDVHTSPREEARFIARKHLLINDFATFYRERLKNQPSAGAILGLGETGNEQDYGLISNFKTYEDPKIKCAVITAMWYLSPTNSIEYMLSCLESTIPKVRKTSKTLLKTSKSLMVLTRMKEKLKQNDPNLRNYALDTIFRFGGWQALEDILGLISYEEDEAALKYANTLLERWVIKAARFYVRIDLKTEALIMDYLTIIKEKNRISENLLQQLTFITQTRK